MDGPRILVVYSHIPTPDHDGGSLRIVNLMSLLTELSCQVTILPYRPRSEPADDPKTVSAVARLAAAGVGVVTYPQAGSVEQHLRQDGGLYDIVMLSAGIHVAGPLLDIVRLHSPRALVWFDTLDISYLREFRHAKLLGNRSLLQQAIRTKQRELALASQADRTIVVSEVEARLLERDAPGVRTHLVSNVHSVHGRGAPFEDRHGMLFIGNYQHQPNMDGLRFFIEQVMPLLRGALPGVPLTIIGADPPAEMLALAAEAGDVILAGHVPDLGPHYNACRLSVAPLRFGAGVKGKVLLSLGYGVPVVGTSVAAEGSHLVDGHNMRIADTPAGLARAIVEVYTEPALWQRLSDNGLAAIERMFSFETARRQLQELLSLSFAAERTRSIS